MALGRLACRRALPFPCCENLEFRYTAKARRAFHSLAYFRCISGESVEGRRVPIAPRQLRRVTPPHKCLF
jgi:hypothetical protein